MSSVICPGELLIDFICTDKGSSMVDSLNFLKKPGGAPANVSVAIKKMGVTSYFLGCVGADPFGTFLENTLKKYEVDCQMLKKTKDFSTTFAYVSLKEDGDRDFYFARGADEHFSIKDLDYKILEEATIFHFGSATAFLGGELTETYYELLNYAVKHNKIVSFDPNYRDLLFSHKIDSFVKHCKEFIKHSHILKVSDEEATLLTNDKDVSSASKALCDLGAKFVITTLGSKGALLTSKEVSKLVTTTPVEMVDATGAGDAFIGSLIAQTAQQFKNPADLNFDNLVTFIDRANLVGSITVQSYGALESIPTLEVVEKIYEKISVDNSK